MAGFNVGGGGSRVCQISKIAPRDRWRSPKWREGVAELGKLSRCGGSGLATPSPANWTAFRLHLLKSWIRIRVHSLAFPKGSYRVQENSHLQWSLEHVLENWDHCLLITAICRRRVPMVLLF